MPLVTRLFVFAVALTAVLSAWKVVNAVTGSRDHKESRVVFVDSRSAEGPTPVEAPLAPEAPLPAEAPAIAELPAAPPIPMSPARVRIRSSNGTRIITENGAVFMELRGDRIVGGLTDSLRSSIGDQIQLDAKSSGGKLERAIQGAVVSGLAKVISKEITLPIDEISDIQYTGKRIVISYKNGKPPGVLNFETVSNDDSKLLSMFPPEEAEQFVAAVRAQLKKR